MEIFWKYRGKMVHDPNMVGTLKIQSRICLIVQVTATGLREEVYLEDRNVPMRNGGWKSSGNIEKR